LLEDDLKNKDTEAFDIIWLHEETKFLFKHADKIRDLVDTELRQILIWVRYNGQILYKKNQGVSNPDFCLSYALSDVLSSMFFTWGDKLGPFWTYAKYIWYNPKEEWL
jgi:hypothetical protein